MLTGPSAPDVCFSCFTRKASTGKDLHPAFCDLAVGPRHCPILVYADHDVIVVAHDRVGAQINGAYGTK